MTTSQEEPNAGGVDTDALTEKELRDRIRLRNTETIVSLERQLRSPLGIIPFVGAGMSATVRLSGDPPGFPQWRELLSGLAKDRHIEAEVKALLEIGDYERAASKFDEDRPGILPQRIRDAFDREVADAELSKGPLSYLPFLATGPVITTNFDRVLEQVPAVSSKPSFRAPCPTRRSLRSKQTSTPSSRSTVIAGTGRFASSPSTSTSAPMAECRRTRARRSRGGSAASRGFSSPTGRCFFSAAA